MGVLQKAIVGKAIRTFPIALTVSAVLGFGIITDQAAGEAPAALKTFLEREGFGGSQLHRRLGNHLFATTFINGRATALMIDTGAPQTLLDWGTIEQLKLDVRNSHVPVAGIWGSKPGHYGATNIG